MIHVNFPIMSVLPTGKQTYVEIPGGRNNITTSQLLVNVFNNQSQTLMGWLNDMGEQVTINRIKFMQDDSLATSYNIRIQLDGVDQVIVGGGGTVLNIPVGDTNPTFEVVFALDVPVIVPVGVTVGSTIQAVGTGGDETSLALVGYAEGAASCS